MLQNVIDLIFPKSCLSCRTRGSFICQNCQKLLRPVFPQVCPVCQRAGLGGLTHPKCQTKYQLDGLYSGFSYEGTLRKIIKRVKFNPFYYPAIEELCNLLSLPKVPPDSILVPVPLHPIRLKWRGFNQAELIAKNLGQRLGLPVATDSLKRHLYTRSQSQLNKWDRQENVAQAFIFDSKRLKHRSIILVDDIWTTGATLRICGKIIKEAGVTKVLAFTLAK